MATTIEPWAAAWERLFASGLTVLILIASTNVARAQSWVLPAGEGAVSFTYQTLDNTGHRATDGRTLAVASSFDMSLYLDAEYAFTNRFSLDVGLPYVFAKYTDSNLLPRQFHICPSINATAGIRVSRTLAPRRAIT